MISEVTTISVVREYECAFRRRARVAAGGPLDSSGSVPALFNALGGSSVETGVDR